MKIAHQDIARLLAEHPDLTVDGWQYRLPRGGDGFSHPRQLMLTDEFRQQVEAASNYIEAHGVEPKAGSYSLKHDIERSAKPGHKVYVPNGAAIAAALLLGWSPIRDPFSPNCTFKRLPVAA